MFVRGSNPIWLFDDLIGKILDDSYYISFLSNTFPYLPQLVTHDNQGLLPWAQPIEFLANGTLPPDIFGDPNLVYRLEVRQAQVLVPFTPSQSDPLIYVINDYVFGPGQSINPTIDSSEDNQISNPQFAFVNFLDYPGNPATPDPQIVFTAAGTYPIAPGWNLVLTGSGTCTVTQFISSGSQNTFASPSPPYWLEFQTIGWTSVILEQTLNGNGGIWYNNYVAATIFARSNDSIAHPISVNYVPNTPGAPVPIISSQPLTVGSFSHLLGVATLFPPTTPDSSNSTLNTSAFVNIQISLPTAGTVDISNIQLYGIENSDQTLIPVAGVLPEETIERQLDHLAHYYDPQLAFKPIPSWLVGWDFILNPAQLGSTVAHQNIGANKSKYVWDQTIMFQSVDDSVNISRGNLGGIQIATVATTQVALIQYLGAPVVNDILLNNISVYMKGLTASGTLKGTISLWYTSDASLPNVDLGTNNSIVLTLDANGKPATFNGNWTEVPLKNLQEATFKLSTTITEFTFPFWKTPSTTNAANAKFFAIVIGFQSIPSGTINPQILSVGMNSGDIATAPLSQSEDEVLRQCQYYFEKSYDPDTAIGTVTAVGIKFNLGITYLNVGANTADLYENQFELQFHQQKRIAPQMSIFAPDGTLGYISCGLRLGNTVPMPSSGNNPDNRIISGWVATISTSNVLYTQNNDNPVCSVTPLSPAFTSEQYFHYVADSRLGVV